MENYPYMTRVVCFFSAQLTHLNKQVAVCQTEMVHLYCMKRIDLRKISFGTTSAIVTGIALIGTLFFNPGGKIAVISSLLIFAIADNIADTFGIHMYQDSELLKEKQVWTGTIVNYVARLAVSLLYIGILLIAPPFIGALLCIGIGFCLLVGISYFIALRRKTSPFVMIVEHTSLAVFVLLISTVVGNIIRSHLR